MGRGVWEGRWLAVVATGLLDRVCQGSRFTTPKNFKAGWLAVVGMAEGGGSKMGLRAAGGTLARVYNASTDLYDAI